MSTTIGARSVMLAAASPRLLASANARINVKTNTPVFHVNTSGVSDPTSINFTATFDEMEGTVTWSASGATLTSISGNTCTLLPANMPGTSATVTATMTYRGTVFSTPLSISKVVDGTIGDDGAPGARGAGTYYATGSSWLDATADAATPGSNVLDDVVTISNGTTFINTKRWNGSAWVAIGTVIDGSLVVTGSLQSASYAGNSVTASKINITTSGGTLNRDPNFTDFPTSWTVGGTLAAFTGPGGASPANTYVAASGGVAGFASCTETIAIDATKTYVLSGSVYTDGGNNRLCSFVIDFYNASDVRIASTGWGDATYTGIVKQFTPTSGDWYPYKDGKFGAGTSKTIPSTARYCKIGVYLNAGGSSATLMAVTSLRLEEMIPGVLIKDGAITADKITVTSLSAITSNFGTVDIATGGYLKSGQSAYHTGTGFWLGSVSGVPKFSIGNPSGASLRWDGTNLLITSPTYDTFTANATGTLTSVVSNGAVTYGSLSASVTGGTAPFTYSWYVEGVRDDNDPGVYAINSGQGTTSISIRGNATNMWIYGHIELTVTDATGRVAIKTLSHTAKHGTYSPP